ncbi:MAG: hypothetical protein N2378_13145 [Chloroflexaceae bacterium]|nr:hypothetical protein [Chloroflexaceae bacterium]
MEHLPPWLRNLPLPSPPTGRDQSEPPAEDEEVPEWLRDLRREVSDEARTGAAETPEWLQDVDRLASPPPAEPAPPTPPLGATSWLTGLGRDEPGAPASPPPAEEQPTTTSRIKLPEGATDWLRSIGPDPDAPSEPLSGPLSEPLDQTGVPDWLRDLNVDEVARAVDGELPGPPEGELTGNLAVETPSADAGTFPAQRTPTETGAQPSEPLLEEPDWLREFMAPEEQKPSSASQPRADLADEAEVPTWLREIAEAAQEPSEVETPAAPPAEGQELPAWLREAALAEAPAASEEVPTWLREAVVDTETPAENREPPPWLQAAQAQAPAASEEVPAWLREAVADAEMPPPAEGQELPAWLREAGEAPPAGTEREVPAWLREAGEAPPAGAEREVPAWLQEAGEAPPAGAEGEVPVWLRETPEVQAPEAEEPSVPGGDLPPWLLAAESADRAPAAAGGVEPDLPAWLHDAPAESASSPVAPSSDLSGSAERGREEGDSVGFLRGAELPGWLRVPEPELPAETAAGQQLDWLRRLGGLEAEESDVEAPVATVAARPRPVFQPTAEQLGAMRLLQQLAATPYPTSAPVSVPVERAARRRLDLERLLYALLALALLIALLAPQITAPLRPAAPVTGNATALGALLDSLDSDDVVLMAYEWAAQRSGELRPLEEAVTRRLIANRTKLILVSTDLQGTLLSFDLIEPLRAAGYNNENGVSFGGRDYVLLGYRPGGELAVRGLAQDLRGALASDFDGQDASQGLVANFPDGTPRISGIEDLALIVVLADQPQDVQVWMEQAHRQVRDQVPIAFLLPQDAQPLALPYLRLPNVYAIAGQQGALALLASDPTADPADLSRATGQLAFAVVAFVVLLLLGAGAGALMRQRSASGGAT